MTTLRSLAFQFIDDITGSQTTDSRLDERDVILKIRQILNEVMILSAIPRLKAGDGSAITQYISTYQLTINNDPLLNRAFVTLPEFYASLIYNKGIHRIFFQKDKIQDSYKDVVLSHHPSIGNNQRAGNLANVYYAYVEGFNIYFRNLVVEPKENPVVVVQIIVAAPDSIGINDTLPIIPEQQSEVLKRLKMYYTPVPLDLVVNNNPNV